MHERSLAARSDKRDQLAGESVLAKSLLRLFDSLREHPIPFEEKGVGGVQASQGGSLHPAPAQADEIEPSQGGVMAISQCEGRHVADHARQTAHHGEAPNAAALMHRA